MEKQCQVAILIDGDNVSAKYAGFIKQEASSYGNIKFFRLYGSISSPTVKAWYSVMPTQGINPVLQISYANGKSIADQALTIDAMDLLYSGEIDVFCIVSSDSDFTKLAYRLKETGKLVIGMGEQKTKESLANACDKFMILDLIYKSEEEIEDKEDEEVEQKKRVDEPVKEDEETTISVPQKEDVLNDIVDLLDTYFADEKRVHLSKIGKLLANKLPGFDARNYGYKNMRQFLSESSELDVIDEKAPDGIHNITYIEKK